MKITLVAGVIAVVSQSSAMGQTGRVRVTGDVAVAQMVEKHIELNSKTKTIPGYRVQIYSSNHPTRGKTGALELEQRVKQTISVQVYVIYATPSWKVRLGDFLTAEQAAEFRDTFKALFPDLADYTYIVRDQVKIR